MSWLFYNTPYPVSSTRTQIIREIQQIHRQDFILQLEDIVNQTIQALESRNHTYVINNLKYFITYDLELRRIVQEPPSFQEDVQDALLTKIIDFQTAFNLMRTNLILEIVKIFIEGYNEANKFKTINSTYSIQCYNFTKELNEQYIAEIQKLLQHNMADEHETHILKECLQMLMNASVLMNVD